MRLLARSSRDGTHGLDFDQGALDGTHRRTLRLVAERVPLEAVIVRGVVHVAFGLGQLMQARSSRHVDLLVRCHRHLPSVVVGDGVVKLDDLHEARSGVDLSKLLMELVEHGGAVRVVAHIVVVLFFVAVRAQDMGIVKGGLGRAESPLLEVVERGVTAGLVRRNRVNSPVIDDAWHALVDLVKAALLGGQEKVGAGEGGLRGAVVEPTLHPFDAFVHALVVIGGGGPQGCLKAARVVCRGRHHEASHFVAAVRCYIIPLRRIDSLG